MKNYKYSNNIISLITTAVVLGGSVLGFTGCAQTDDGRNDAIELIEPVTISVNYDIASRRTLYKSTVISSIVCPPVTEEAFGSDVTFLNYECLPGEEVAEGDVLVNCDTTNLDNQIKNLRESISDMETSFNETVEQLQDNYDKAEADYNRKKEIFEGLESDKPEEDDSEYNKWLEQYNYWDSASRYSYISFENAKLALKKQEELYDLDLNYNKNQLNSLIQQRKEKTLVAENAGTVAAINYEYTYYSGYWVSKGTIGMALADTSAKELRCDYVNQKDVNKAEEVFAVINGQRYEIEYQPMNSEEYKRLLKENDVVYSTFLFKDDVEVNYGDFAAIVLVNEVKRDVLCVPKSAVYTGTEGNYVYRFENDSYVETPVKTGSTDGAFIEILSGIEEGDMVKADYKIKSGAKEDQVKYGSVCSKFSGDGILFYPAPEPIKNPVENGITYVDEVLVKRNEPVVKGQVLAKVHVLSDSVELSRNERLLQRRNERLADLVADNDDDKNKYSINSLNNEIADLEEKIGKLKKDAAVTEIVAPYDGIVTSVTSHVAGDILESGEEVIRLSGEDSCFVVLEDKDGRLSLGNKTEISFSYEGQSYTVEGEVATVNPLTLSKSLKSDYALIKLPAESLGLMAGTNKNSQGMWDMTRFTVKAELRKMENVLTVPKNAVTVIGTSTYVTVKEDNGTLKMVSFISGGSDSDNYWVIDGLTEGQTICWE